ncbi:serine/threonine-protein kinase PLK1-like [Amphibalanus amphitrite]|uniref:serine/threonine-protein kinase PLK1-like n=1 Tax=Amphibalanus amphitrite TaxID=1232801 RepID=UPI001C926B45|nr:serine/threonine-protein kinase PLK1-like [Amphibalanus amphitrite]XP_043236980.1 serine/threonine-protein kinase PLK1-like [Amphibalanus amphitrite]
MASRPRVDTTKEIAQVILDPKTRKRYQRGKFLGKGGFARCYELVDPDTKEVLAGKIVSKALLVKQHQKEKMTQEITIHRELHHKHIVGFSSFFEDSENVYIVLELCRKRSLMELHKRRKAISEPETRYFLQHVLLGVKFLHERNIIHRDLKLGNLFLNDEMEVKIGDFGLATRVDYTGERKRTLCGTPNYIAPEILAKKGHSFEVDVWSIGCILYTLLVGRPPFETESLKETYTRIKKNEYSVPKTIGPLARNLIHRILQGDPARRPTVDQILHDDFMTMGYIPVRLPTSCLTMAPRFDTKMNVSIVARRPLVELNKESAPSGAAQKEVAPPPEPASEQRASRDCYLKVLHGQLKKLLDSSPANRAKIEMDEAEDPAAVPFLWFSKWVDYSDKYGLGYQLCDDSIGIIFNDSTKLMLLANGEDIHYIERDGTEHYYTMKDYPKETNKKVVLLKYFRNYMNEHLVKAGAAMKPREGDELSRIPSMRAWFRSRSAIVLHLTNGTLQINFFDDHSKVILCPMMGAVTYIDEKKSFRTYRFSLLEEFGCSEELANRLLYAKTMVERLLTSRSVSASATKAKVGSATASTAATPSAAPPTH